jgi:hypothetical protein
MLQTEEQLIGFFKVVSMIAGLIFLVAFVILLFGIGKKQEYQATQATPTK